jgi:[glutamine synthetase] adenylyltransferase / [glutamine synthetase]-adenylyl-L-tyrosine phosphorylase
MIPVNMGAVVVTPAGSKVATVLPATLSPWERQLLDHHGEAAATVLRLADAIAPQFPDPPQARRDLEAFIEVDARTALTLRQFAADPRALELLLRLGQVSRYAFDLARQYPGMFWDVVQDRQYRQFWSREAVASQLAAELAAVADWTAKGNALARCKHRHWLRILCGELTGELRFTQIVQQLSEVVDALVGAALNLAVERLRPRFGTVVPDDHPLFPGLVVLGMGKLGGGELNYSSDIDLIFVYDLPPAVEAWTCWVGQTDHHDYFKRLGSELIRLLEVPGDGASLLRVDMRLRPEGDRGELALSRRETVDYYYAVGRPWERQAMLKARALAGPTSLSRRLEAELLPWIYPQEPVVDDLEESRAMRRRIEERAQVNNVKTGAGGIRDIEFLVQFFQLCYGGRLPELRRHDTLPTLTILVDRGIIPRREAAQLAEHYVWLRTVEHRLQVWDDRQEHELPADSAARAQLARRCGFTGTNALVNFDAKHQLVRATVRAIAAKHYLGDTRDQDALLALLVQGELDPARAAKALAEGRFADPPAAARRLRAMAVEPFFLLARSRTERALAKLLPVLLHLIGETPEPDQTLANFERIVEAVGGRATFFELLGERPDVLRVFTDLAGWSTFLVDLFHDFPGLPDDMVDALNQQGRTAIHLHHEARSLAQGLTDPAEPLAHLMAREQAAVAIRDLAGLASGEIGEHLTAVCEAVTDTLLATLARNRARTWGHPRDEQGRPTRFALIALGKLGGRELSYASDLDIILVCDPGGTCAKNQRDGQEFWFRVAQDLTQTMTDRHIAELDARLRPWGDSGELVCTTTAIARYWAEPRELWERLAMVRAAHLAGDPRLAVEVVELLRRAAIASPLPADAAQQVRTMRQRLEASVAGRDHVKRGWGGYVDIEFIAQYLSLGLDPAQVPTPASTIACLARLAELGRIPAVAAAEMTEDLRFLRFVEGRMRLWVGKAVSSLPVHGAERAILARRCHHPDLAAFDLALHLARERSRRWFDTLIR